MPQNPFKFGSIVDEPFFTDRVKEQESIYHFLDSNNHLVLIGPRRFGKTSLIQKVVNRTQRPFIYINIQQISSVKEFTSTILKRVFKTYPLEKIKFYLSTFRIVPTISISSLSDSFDISFQAKADTSILLEDSFSLLERISTPNEKLIVIFDEFQEILQLEQGIDKKLRAIIQEHKMINYIFLGSQESMMKDIFENIKSPFYNFGEVQRILPIPYEEFFKYIHQRLNMDEEIIKEILNITSCYPYYTQQLASKVWELHTYYDDYKEDIVNQAAQEIVQNRDLDFERLWITFNNLDKSIIKAIAFEKSPFEDLSISYQTIYSAIRKLLKKGYIIDINKYDIEDPFFKMWIINNN